MLQLSINAYVPLVSAPQHNREKGNQSGMALRLAPINAEGNPCCPPRANPLKRIRDKKLCPVHQEEGQREPVWVFSSHCHDVPSQV